MKLELFILDPVTRMVDINKPWISTIKEFKKILQRDRGSEGDSQGRLKLQATREFTFIYHYCDVSSKFINYAKEEQFKECLKNADLPETLDIEKDNDLLVAILRYKSMQKAASLEMLLELREALHTGVKVVRKIRMKLEKELLKDDIEDLVVQDDKGRSKLVDPVAKLTDWLTSLMKISGQIHETIKQIDELEEEIKKQLAEGVVMRGDVAKGETEDGIGRRPSSPFKLVRANE